MEETSEKRQEIRLFLKEIVNPIVEPLIKDILKQRPNDIMKFIYDYSAKRIDHHSKPQDHSDQEDEQQKDYLRKLEEKKKKKIQKKTSRQGISAEAFGAYNKKAQFTPRVIPKTKEVEEAIKKLTSKSILFQNLNSEDLQIVISAMQQVQAKPGQEIIKQGDKGDTLYVVGSGQYDCTKIIGGKQTYLKTYKYGESFGELALMYNAPRAATITCKIEGTMYGLDRVTFNNIIQQAAIKKRKASLQILSKVQIFQDVDPYGKQQVCDVLVEQTFPAGQYIFKQGQDGNRFYMVASGSLIAEKSQDGQRPKKVFAYKEGDYFGEIALVKNTVRQASIKAETEVRVVSIDSQAFKRLLGPIEDILSKNMQKYKKYIQN